MQTIPDLEKLILKVKTREQVAEEYGIFPKTLAVSLKKKGVILKTGYIFPATQLIIYKTLGPPPYLKIS